MAPAFFIKRARAQNNILLFLAFAVTSVLVTRLYLEFFNYPQLAHGSIHLAHAIWGGLFLLAANILVLSFHSRRMLRLAAIIGGIGFGQLIDEVGKFITRDNNYFFQPVPVIIYISFVGLFYLYRYLSTISKLDARTKIYEIFEYLEEVAENNFSMYEKKRVMSLVRSLSKEKEEHYHQFAEMIADDIATIPAVKHKQESAFIRTVRSLISLFDRYSTQKTFVYRAVLLIMVTYITSGIVAGITLGALIFSPGYLASLREGQQIAIPMYIGQIVSQIIAMWFVIKGFYVLRGSKRKGLENFRTGISINIFITHIFLFYFEQFSAAIGLMFTIAVYITITNILEYAVAEEVNDPDDE